VKVQPPEDAFIRMVTAERTVDLPLGDYHPRSMLVVPTHDVRRARFPAIDYHNHLDAQDPQAVLAIMDECGTRSSRQYHDARKPRRHRNAA